jgi:hypothetical protein
MANSVGRLYRIDRSGPAIRIHTFGNNQAFPDDCRKVKMQQKLPYTPGNLYYQVLPADPVGG